MSIVGQCLGRQGTALRDNHHNINVETLKRLSDITIMEAPQASGTAPPGQASASFGGQNIDRSGGFLAHAEGVFETRHACASNRLAVVSTEHGHHFVFDIYRGYYCCVFCLRARVAIVYTYGMFVVRLGGDEDSSYA